jgi:hypothetical protein
LAIGFSRWLFSVGSTNEYANKLIKLQNDLLQTLDRRRRGNSQSIVVKHVHIHPGAQGVVGIVNQDESQNREGDQN